MYILSHAWRFYLFFDNHKVLLVQALRGDTVEIDRFESKIKQYATNTSVIMSTERF